MTAHINQPDGPFRPSTHPAIAGRERELRSLVDGIRRLVELAVRHVAPADQTAAWAGSVHALADEMERHVPETPFSRFQAQPASEPHDASPYDFVTGLYNPLALPVEMRREPPRALGRARFTTPYEGPPGCVHGAVIAGSFDMVMSAANVLADAAGPTARLTIRYRRPTLLHRDLEFEASVHRVEGRRTQTHGRIVQDGQVTVEAEGLFIQLPRDEVFRLHQR